MVVFALGVGAFEHWIEHAFYAAYFVRLAILFNPFQHGIVMNSNIFSIYIVCLRSSHQKIIVFAATLPYCVLFDIHLHQVKIAVLAHAGTYTCICIIQRLSYHNFDSKYRHRCYPNP
jgi:hypothetical protein